MEKFLRARVVPSCACSSGKAPQSPKFAQLGVAYPLLLGPWIFEETPPMKKIFVLVLLCAAFAIQAAYAARGHQDVVSACPIGEDYDCGDNVLVKK